LHNTIIYLIGFGGTGKLTIAKELAKLENFKIVDNHLINNPVFNFVDLSEGVPSYAWPQVRKIREAVYETIANYSPSEMNFIFTNELFEFSDDDKLIYEKVKAIAESRKSDFFPVRLLVGTEEHKKELKRRDENRLSKLQINIM
jgi:hypothetical protein